MKAVVFYEHGGPEVLKLANVDTPKPGKDQVLIQLDVAAVNRMDLWTRKGWQGLKISYPHITGADGAGEIVEVGSDVQKWKIGDKVVINSNLGCGECDFCLAGKDNLCRNWHLLGETKPGTYAEYIAIPFRNVKAVPKDFNVQYAAAAALVFHTAWHSLITRANLRPGEKVLVVGAAGGVNTASIEIAKLVGAIVYVVGSDRTKLALAQSLGADYLIDRSEDENWSKTLHELTEKRGVDIIVDNVGTTFSSSFRAARKGGKILTVGNTGGAKFEIDNRFIFGKHLTIIGSSMGTIEDFNSVMDMVFSGKLVPIIDRSYPLSEINLAHERMENNEQLGKITLDINH